MTTADADPVEAAACLRRHAAAAPSAGGAAPAIELIHAARWYGNVVAVNDISSASAPA